MKVQKTKRLVVGDIHGNYDKFNTIYNLENQKIQILHCMK